MSAVPSTGNGVWNSINDWLPRECIAQLRMPSYRLDILALLLLLLLLLVVMTMLLLTLLLLDSATLVVHHHLLQRQCCCRTRSLFKLPMTRADPSR